MIDARGLLEKLRNLLHHLVGAGQRGRLGQLGVDEKDPLVFVGQKAGGPMGEHEPRPPEDRQKESEHDPFSSNQPCGRRHIPVPREPQKTAEPGQRTPFYGFVRSQQGGAKGGAERQGVNGRKDHRSGDGDGELPVKLTGDARNERHRHEYGQHHQGGGDNGGSHLAHGFGGGFFGCKSFFFHNPLNIFNHHDGIVHHQADGQDQGEKGQGVGAESQEQQDREAAHQGNGNGECGDERCAPVLKKEKRNSHHQ